MEIYKITHTLRITATDLVGTDTIQFSTIKQKRALRKNLSLEKLAYKIGLTRSTLAKYERGAYIPKSWLTLKTLCLTLCVSADDLLNIGSDDINLFNMQLVSIHRKYNKISIRQLSALLGKSDTAAGHYEWCDPPSSWVTLKKLCKELDISVNDVLGISLHSEVILNKALTETLNTYTQ